MSGSAKIIAVDFDDTLCENAWPGIGEPIQEVLAAVKAEQAKGAKLILWTCRRGKPLDKAVEWCSAQGLEFDAVNENLPETIERYGGDSRKITCDVYIGDEAVSAADFKKKLKT